MKKSTGIKFVQLRKPWKRFRKKLLKKKVYSKVYNLLQFGILILNFNSLILNLKLIENRLFPPDHSCPWVEITKERVRINKFKLEIDRNHVNY